MPFLSLVTLTFDLDLQTRPSEGPKCLTCEFGTNPFSGSRDISHTNKDKAIVDYISPALCTPVTPFPPIGDAAYRQHAGKGPSHGHRQHARRYPSDRQTWHTDNRQT